MSRHYSSVTLLAPGSSCLGCRIICDSWALGVLGYWPELGQDLIHSGSAPISQMGVHLSIFWILTDTAQTPETSGTCNSRKQLLSLTPLRQWNGWIALDATRPSLL
jgi:hypothetical protein